MGLQRYILCAYFVDIMFCDFSMKSYVVGTHKDCLLTIFFRLQNIDFHEEIRIAVIVHDCHFYWMIDLHQKKKIQR